MLKIDKKKGYKINRILIERKKNILINQKKDN